MELVIIDNDRKVIIVRGWKQMVQGIVSSASWLVSAHGETTLAFEMLRHLGVTRAEAIKMQCDKYDMDILIKEADYPLSRGFKSYWP